MAKITIDPKKLVLMNREIKRELSIDYDSKAVPQIVNCHGHDIRAIPIGFPTIVHVSGVEFPFGKPPNCPELDNKPFFFKFHGKAYALDGDEVAVLLGTDYHPHEDVADINARLEVCRSGPSSANAYVLGSINSGISKTDNHVVIPVQYYQIPKKMHEGLAIEHSSKTGLELMLEKLRSR